MEVNKVIKDISKIKFKDNYYIAKAERDKERHKNIKKIYTQKFLKDEVDILCILNSLTIIDYKYDKYFTGDVLGLKIPLLPNNKKILSEVIKDFDLYFKYYSKEFLVYKNSILLDSCGLFDCIRRNKNQSVRLSQKNKFYIKEL